MDTADTLVREVGNWVLGERFWDRQAEIRDFIELLDEGAHILLVAPRRVGKTSLMHEVALRLEDRYTALYIDLQKAHSPDEAILELSMATREHQSIWQKTTQAFRNVLGNLDSIETDELRIKLRDGIAGDWQAKGERILQNLATIDRPLVAFFDELPILVNRLLKGADHRITPEQRQKTDAFVSWLRAQSIRHRGKIRFVIAGSIGLEPILAQAGLSATVNTFTPFDLHPWDRKTTVGCLGALANNYRLTYEAGARERMYELLGCGIPHHVQLFFDHVYRDSKRRNSTRCEISDVERVYHKSMLSTRGRAELRHYEERLGLMVGETLLPLARDLLTEAAVTGAITLSAANEICDEHIQEPREKAARLREILEIFEHDGYLRRDGERYIFISRLLADWWSARFSFNYVPVSERGQR